MQPHLPPQHVQGVHQRMQTQWNSPSLSCLKTQPQGPIRLGVQGGQQQVQSSGGQFSLGCTHPGISVKTGSQLSLISKATLQIIPTSMYSRGTSSRVKVMTYAREGKVILTMEVMLKLNGKILKLSAIKEDLNNGSGYSFPTPSKWRTFTGTLTSPHLGQISILLGGNNHLVFPSEIESGSQRVNEASKNNHQLNFVGYNFVVSANQLLYQGEDDHGQLHAHLVWPQPQPGYTTSSWRCTEEF